MHTNHTIPANPQRPVVPQAPMPVAQRTAPGDHHGLMDAFHLPATQAERHAVRLAAEQRVGPLGV